MKRKALFTLILGTALAVAPAATRSALDDGGGNGSGRGGSAGQALVIRGEALNKLYGNAVTALTPQQFKSLYEPASAT